MTGPPRTVVRAAAVAAVLLMGVSCAPGRSCERSRPTGPGCADLEVDGTSYDEWRPFHGPRVLQEVGDGTYPACNSADACDSEGLGDHGATDVWRLEGVDPARALVGLRENSRTRVIFVRVGLDPDAIRPTRSVGTFRPAG